MGAATTTVTRPPIVVGYDARDESEVALDRAIAEASERQLPLVILVVMPLETATVNPLLPDQIGVDTLPELTPDGPVAILPILEAARRRLGETQLDGRVTWSFGSPAAEIVRLAEDEHAAAIVVGTHHHSKLSRLLGADIAAGVVRHAQCDVIIAR